jgi:hypothetical protein
LGADETLFLEGAQGLGADLEPDLLAVDDDRLVLKIRLPNLLGVALRKADIAAVLLAFAGDVADLHDFFLTLILNSTGKYSEITGKSQHLY